MRTFIVLLTICLTPILLTAQTGYVQEGKASFYSDKFEGRTTASGERYSHAKSTCAHLTLPFGTLVRVTNLANSQSIVVRVNDRGPFVANRIIDLSRSAAEKLSFLDLGIADVRVEVIDEEGKVMAQTPAPLRVDKQPETPPVKRIESESQQQAQVVTPPQRREEVAPPKPEPNPISTPPTQAESSEIELYDLKVTRQKPAGFTVQIGSYKELVNLLRIADDLKTSLKKEVRVQVANINGEKIYRLMVGEFKTRRDADIFKKQAAEYYPDCFIVELK
jgi:rare lipoprotein A